MADGIHAVIRSASAWLRRVIKGFTDHNCSMYAAGLTYFSMLALVPVFCCILAVAKVVGVDDAARSQINVRIEAMIVNIERGQEGDIARLVSASEEEREERRLKAKAFGEVARKISSDIFGRIDNFDISTFGWIGFGFLLWTVVSSLGMVEVSFNRIWGAASPRPLWKRFLIYLFIMVVMPVVAAAAMSLPVLNFVKDAITAVMGATAVTRWASEGIVRLVDSWCFRYIVTFVFASLDFAFFFWLLPNRKVRPAHAWYGGLITALLFGCWMKLCAVAQIGISKTSAMYGSFAFLPIVLAWMYMSWQLVLLGANMVKAFEEEK
jgi:membrane protein